MMVALALLVLGGLVAVVAPRVLTRSPWPDREPVLALWAWQCAVVTVLLCCVLAMALSGAAAWQAVRGHVFAPAPSRVVAAYGLSTFGGSWPAVMAVLLACGGLWTAAMLTREVRDARARRRQRCTDLDTRAPLLPGEEPGARERLVVVEGERPDAWWLPGAAPRLVVTTAALRRLEGERLGAILAHEQGHLRARHDWLLYCASALASGFPRVPVFLAFRDQVHRLVELAADDAASRRFGRLTTALALIELNEERGVFGPGAPHRAQVPQRVYRLLEAPPRLPVVRRLRLTALVSLAPAVPLAVAFVPGVRALG